MRRSRGLGDVYKRQVQSFLFEITVDAEIGGYKRQFVALVHRRSRTEIPILYFHWK
jgi:hypothetical protein